MNIFGKSRIELCATFSVNYAFCKHWQSLRLLLERGFGCSTANCGRAFVCCVNFAVEPAFARVDLLLNHFILCCEFEFLTGANEFTNFIHYLLMWKFIYFINMFSVFIVHYKIMVFFSLIFFGKLSIEYKNYLLLYKKVISKRRLIYWLLQMSLTNNRSLKTGSFDKTKLLIFFLIKLWNKYIVSIVCVAYEYCCISKCR